jgi:hypothetical protein
MADKLTRLGARSLTMTLDRVASVFQNHHDLLGVPEDIAMDFAKRADRMSDAVETTASINFPKAASDDKEAAPLIEDTYTDRLPDEADLVDEDADSDDQNTPEYWYNLGKYAAGREANGEKVATPEWSQPPKNETGQSVEPGGMSGAGWDPNAIGDDRGGPYKQEPDEP